MRAYRTIDYLTQGYVMLIALLTVLLHGSAVPGWPWVVGAHAAVVLAVHGLILWREHTENRVVEFFRWLYPILLYTGLYWETHLLDGMVLARPLDTYVMAADHWLFGCHPSQVLAGRWSHVLVSELFYAAYFSYYVMVAGTGLYLYFASRRAFMRFITVVSFVFYACYLIYILLPVMGPYAMPPDTPAWGAAGAVLGQRATAPSGPFAAVMHLIYSAFEIEGGAAFPSSHVAVAIATLWFTWPRLRRVRWMHLVAVLLLGVSTVYCGYHYAVDVLAGVVAGLLLIPAGVGLFYWGEHRVLAARRRTNHAAAPKAAATTTEQETHE